MRSSQNKNSEAGSSSSSLPVKKNAFQKHKEEVELRKKKEAEEAAKVYADFLASFEDDEPSSGASFQNSNTASSFTTKAFVRGKSFVPSSVFVKETTEPELVERNLNAIHSATSDNIYKPQVLSSITKPSKEEPEPLKKSFTSSATKKPRVLDEFMGELKRQQEERDERLKTKQIKLPGGNAGLASNSALTLKAAFEDHSDPLEGDPTSNNLYLANISGEADEASVCKAFGKFGPIASVKIMWPRTQEEKERGRNCGFVSFMERSSASAAIKEMDGFSLLGQAIRVSWGKPVAIPPKPIFDINAKPVLLRSGLPFNARTSISHAGGQQKAATYKFVPPPGAKPASQPVGVCLEVHVIIPKDPCVLALIHRVIERVCIHGYAFEGLIMQREAKNEKFKFLFDFDTPEHIYYRWKLYSLLQGDSVDSWRTAPFRMYDDGPFFIPPALNTSADEHLSRRAQSNSASPPPFSARNQAYDASSKGKLSVRQRVEFKRILDELTTERRSVGFAMVAALERVGESEDIAVLIQDSLLRDSLPPAAALAGLYLISDILHNVNPTIPQAWRLRAELEKRLNAIFTHLHKIYKNIDGRLRAETFRRRVAAIIPVWEASLIFPAPFLHQLRNLFQYGSIDAPSESVPSAPVNSYSEYDDVDGIPCNPTDEDVDGAPLEDVYDDIDGVPLASQMEASDDDMFA